MSGQASGASCHACTTSRANRANIRGWKEGAVKKVLMTGVALCALGSVTHASEYKHYEGEPLLQQMPSVRYSCGEGNISDFPAEWRLGNEVRVDAIPYHKRAWLNVYPADASVELRIEDSTLQYKITDSYIGQQLDGKFLVFLKFGDDYEIKPGWGDTISLWIPTEMKTRGGITAAGMIWWNCKP
jgi:hypothetical protein